MKPPPNPISQQLRELRKHAGLSGADAARLAGMSAAKISRVETGAFMPTSEQVDMLCRVYGAPADLQRALVRSIEELREVTHSARVTLQRGGWQMQERIGRIETAATAVRSYSSDTVIGLVQVESYIRAMMADFVAAKDLDQVVRARLDRQRLLDTERHFTLIMSEGALRWNIGGPAVMVEQLAHLVEVSARRNVRLGVIPWMTATRLPGVHAFHGYDSHAVIVGTMNATAIMTNNGDVAEYSTWFDRLESVASFDDDAREVIERVAEDYRSIA